MRHERPRDRDGLLLAPAEAAGELDAALPDPRKPLVGLSEADLFHLAPPTEGTE